MSVPPGGDTAAAETMPAVKSDFTDPGTDWTLRALDRIPGPPIIAFLLAVVGITGISILYRVAAGDPAEIRLGFELFRQWYIWLDVLIAVIAAYNWVANGWLHRGILRDLSMLRPSLDLSESEFTNQVNNIASVPPVRLFISGLCGALALAAMPIFDSGFWTTQRPEFFSLDMAFYLGRQMLIGWLMGHASLREWIATRGFARLGGEHARVDLLDLRPLRPFATKGLRSSGIWLLASSIVSLLWLTDSVSVAVGPIVAIVLLVSLGVFLYPLVPLHALIVAEKNKRLDQLRDAIRSEKDPLHAKPDEANPRLANLVALYSLTENAREWPLETNTVLRFVAFAVLGLGSWLGGALVERLLQAFV